MTALLLRRHRTALLAWVLGLLALVAVTVPSYEATYGDPAAGSVLVAQLQDTPSLELLYGPLPDPGTIGQLFAWETGTYVLVLAAVMAVILGVALTRGEEDAGTTELVRSVGVRPPVPLLAALTVLALTCLVVGGGSALILVGQAAVVDELEVTGGIGYGAVLFLSSLAFGVLAVIAAQLRGDLRSGRGMALAAVAVLLVVRIVADQSAGWVRWLTPLGWRDLVRPWTDDRLWVLAPLSLAVVALAGVAVALAQGREIGSAWLAGSDRGARPLRVRTALGWAWHDARGSVLGWSLAILGTAALFGSMTGGLVQTLARDRATAELLARLGGDVTDPVGTYFAYLGLFVMLLVLICGVTLTLRWRGEESSGRLVHELAVGVPRWQSLLARAAVAGGTVTVLTVSSGLLLGWIGSSQLQGVDALPHALAGTVGDLPGVLVGVGLAALVTAVAPRVTGLVWAVVTASGFLVLLGGLVDVPQRVIDLSLLGQTPAAGLGASPAWASWLTGMPLALAVGALLALVAAGMLVGRRDLRLG